MKVQTHSFLESLLEQSGPDPFDESRFVMTFLTIVGVKEILCRFRLVLEEKTGKETPDSSILEFLKKFLANNFALSNVEAQAAERHFYELWHQHKQLKTIEMSEA